MKPPVDTVRVSQRGKEILIKLKRNTGLDQWNVLCRWALCASLMRESKPPTIKTGNDSNIEMTWKTFGGPHSELIAVLMMIRADFHGVNLQQHEQLAEYFRSHLERGISNIQNVRDIAWLLKERGY